MKSIYFLTLLTAGLISNVFVFGQGKKPDSLRLPGGDFRFGQTAPGYIRPPMVVRASPKPFSVWTQGRGIDSVRIMSPDRMPCLVTDLSRMEQMPVSRLKNLDRMPNKLIRLRPMRVEVIPITQEKPQ